MRIEAVWANLVFRALGCGLSFSVQGVWDLGQFRVRLAWRRMYVNVCYLSDCGELVGILPMHGFQTDVAGVGQGEGRISETVTLCEERSNKYAVCSYRLVYHNRTV